MPEKSYLTKMKDILFIGRTVSIGINMRTYLLLLTVVLMRVSCIADYHVYLNGSGGSYYKTHINDSFNAWSDIDCQMWNTLSFINSDTSLLVTWREGQYTELELEIIDSYVREGGRALFLGENVSATNPDRNQGMRDALSYLNSSITIGLDSFDPVNQTASGEQIIQHSLTENVNSIVYAAANSIEGGASVLLGKDLQTPFFAIEQIGDGYVFVSGDKQISPGSHGENVGNDIFFRNLAVASIPEPNSVIFLFVGVVIIISFRRRRR